MEWTSGSTTTSSTLNETMSPRQIMTGVHHGGFQFGDYVLGHDDSSDNFMDARARGVIYLCPTIVDIQGVLVVHLFDLQTGKRVCCRAAAWGHMTTASLHAWNNFQTRSRPQLVGLHSSVACTGAVPQSLILAHNLLEVTMIPRTIPISRQKYQSRKMSSQYRSRFSHHG